MWLQQEVHTKQDLKMSDHLLLINPIKRRESLINPNLDRTRQNSCTATRLLSLHWMGQICAAEPWRMNPKRSWFCYHCFQHTPMIKVFPTQKLWMNNEVMTLRTEDKRNSKTEDALIRRSEQGNESRESTWSQLSFGMTVNFQLHVSNPVFGLPQTMILLVDSSQIIFTN